MSTNRKIKTPTVSVVMSTCNGQHYINEAIDSIIKQTFTDFEFIIVNDGSIDNTEQIIKSYNDARIVYIHKEKNSGIADSLNLGIKKAKGKYIARMDDDDISLPNRLAVQYSFMQKNNDIVLCACRNYGNKESIKYFEILYHEDIQMHLMFGNTIIHPSVFAKAYIFKENIYNTAMIPSEDYDLWSRIINKGRFCILADRLIMYRHNPNSETVKRRKEQLHLNVSISKRVIEKSGFYISSKDLEFLTYFVSHKYSITTDSFLNVIKWCSCLKKRNKKFDVNAFSVFLDETTKRYVLSYFLNNRISKKICAFMFLDIKYKLFVMNYYFKTKVLNKLLNFSHDK